LAACLAALPAAVASLATEVIVNGSRDGTAERCSPDGRTS
jgi:hypothetical protein